MATEVEEHNKGQEDGAKATFLDELAVAWNPLLSTAYKQGFRHGLQHQPEKKTPEKPRIIDKPSEAVEDSDEAVEDSDEEKMPWFLKLIIAFYLLIFTGIFLFLRWTIRRPWRADKQ
jgi:hypothetical protein